MTKRCIQCGFPMVEGHKCPTQGQGMRHNAGKPRTDLIPAVVLMELGKHYEYGARKYAPNNWAAGFPYSDTYASLTRHLYAWWAGERNDPENGHHHLVAVIWNAVTLLYFELFPDRYNDFDDRVIDAKVKVSYRSTDACEYEKVANTGKAVPYDDGHVQGLTWDEIAIKPCCPIPEGEDPIEPCEHVKGAVRLDMNTLRPGKRHDRYRSGVPMDRKEWEKMYMGTFDPIPPTVPIPEGYAMLRDGDVIQQGDMYRTQSHTWANVLHEDIGMEYSADRMGTALIRKYHPADATSEQFWAITPENRRRLLDVIESDHGPNLAQEEIDTLMQRMYRAMNPREKR